MRTFIFAAALAVLFGSSVGKYAGFYALPVQLFQIADDLFVPQVNVNDFCHASSPHPRHDRHDAHAAKR